MKFFQVTPVFPWFAIYGDGKETTAVQIIISIVWAGNWMQHQHQVDSQATKFCTERM